MNILPKKRWHVRTKDNIARVRRDEAEALEKEKEIQKRAKLAEQESRINFLRDKARGDRSDNLIENNVKGTPITKDANIYTNTGNINFFKEIEAGLQGGSSIKKEEERKEKEEYEKKIGLLTQLGQDSMELSGGKYWYENKSHFRSYMEEDNNDKEVGLKYKVSIDPLNEILKHTSSNMDMPTDKSKRPKCNSPVSSLSRSVKKLKNKKKKHKEKNSDRYLKHKKRKKRKRYSSDEEILNIDMEKLRKERLERESNEKLRAERLLAGKDPDGKDIQSIIEISNQKYNSQFNPNFAKQNRKSF